MSLSDDELDLRPYLAILVKNWWLIGIIAGIFVLLSLAYTLIQPRKYEAASVILVTRRQVKLTFAEQFPTVNEPVDSRYRMDALISITQSDAIAYATFNSISDRLPADKRDIESLRDIVTIISKGDALLINVTAEDPALAAEIANTWANNAVETINQSYRDTRPLVAIQDQLSIAQTEYDSAQAALENFISTNSIDMLVKKATETQTLFDRLASERASKIAFYSERKLLLEKDLVEAEALKEQLTNNSRSNAGEIGDALAVLFARANFSFMNTNPSPDRSTAQNYSSSPSIDLQIAKDSGLIGPTDNYSADLDVIIQLYQSEIVKAEAAVESLGQEVSQAAGFPELQVISTEINALRTQLEQERAREKELINQRDLTWKAYQALAQKEAEIRNVAEVSNQVNLASPAIEPQKPISSSFGLNTIIAAAAGVFVGVILILGKRWWQSS